MKPTVCFLCAARDAVLVHDGWPLCDRCQQQANESAAERQIELFYGASEPVTVTERCHHQDGSR